MRIILATVAACLFLAHPGRTADLEKQLLKEAPGILKYLREKGYKNVGVLKFRSKIGDEPVSDNAGTINLSLADRLEIALALANSPREPIGIIQRASARAAAVRGANHLTVDGRKALFADRYALAWGEEQVMPDAFLTGVVMLDAGLKQMDVGVLAFDQKGDNLAKVAQFKAAVEAQDLVESGSSFLLRGAFDDGQVQLAQAGAVQAAAGVHSQGADLPPERRRRAVTLDIYYDGQKVPVKIEGGKAWVAEPREGQKVMLMVRRQDASKLQYGVVLKVNGENTLYKDRLPAEQSHMWILAPSSGPLEIRGYKVGVDRGEEFRILSRQESKLQEMNYGIDVGTITLTAFREGKAKSKPPDISYEAEDLAALSRSVFPTERPRNLGALQAQLRADAQKRSSRGLIVGGKEIKIETEKVAFEVYPVPVYNVTIHYYKP